MVAKYEESAFYFPSNHTKYIPKFGLIYTETDWNRNKSSQNKGERDNIQADSW